MSSLIIQNVRQRIREREQLSNSENTEQILKEMKIVVTNLSQQLDKILEDNYRQA